MTLPPVDVERARAVLADRFGVVDAVAPIGAGAWSSAVGFTAELDGSRRELVARFGRFREDFVRDAYAGGWAQPGLPVPRVWHIDAVDDEWLAVSDRCHGRYLETLDGAGWQAVLPDLLDALAVLRQCGPEPAVAAVRAATGAAEDVDLAQGAATWHDWLMLIGVDDPQMRTAGWRARLAASPTGTASFDRGVDVMDALSADLAVPRTPVHSDLINRNVFATGARLTGIFDWGCLFAGDFLFDVAWLDFWSPWHPGLAAVDVIAAARDRFPDEPDFDRRLRVCAIHIGLSHLGYNAFIGNEAELAATDRRLADYV